MRERLSRVAEIPSENWVRAAADPESLLVYFLQLGQAREVVPANL